MATQTMADVLITKLLSMLSDNFNDQTLNESIVGTSTVDQHDQLLSTTTKNFTPSLFTAEAGRFRILQPIWDLRIGYEEYVSSPLFPIILSVSFFFTCMLPFTIADVYGQDWKWIQRYKIQPDRKVTWPAIRNAISLTIWNHILYILPVSIAQWVWTPPTVLPLVAPGLWEFCWQQLASLAIFDLEYFCWHTLHHRVRWLYRHVHSVHHHYSSPSSWVTQYLHPYELVTVGIFTTTSPWFFSSHPMTQFSFMQFSIIVSVDAHIGYDLPLLPHHWVPFWGGSIKHDMHHQRPLTNFEPFFSWWDRLFGTDCPGQGAGGYRSKELIAWEKKKKQQMQLEGKKRAASAASAGNPGVQGSSSDADDLRFLGNYGADEPVMEAKRL